MRQRFLRDKERRNFPLRNVDARKARDLLGVMKTKAQRVVLDRQTQPVAHEIDIALDGLGRDLDLLRDLAAIRKRIRAQLRVNAHHPLERRTGKLINR